jgi:hypothetical protein
MRTTILAACVLVGGLLPLVGAHAQTRNPLGGAVPNAPVGHFQPRTTGFAPGSREDQAEQRRLSQSDAEQQKREQALDKKLSICRC